VKAERINQDQGRFTLTEADLAQRNLKFSELAYGTDKTKALFDDMLKQAFNEFGIDFTEKPMMIEAIPISDKTLTITVTRVVGSSQVGGMFGTNLPLGDKADASDFSHNKADGNRSSGDAKEKEEPKKREQGIFAGAGDGIIFQFESFSQLTKACAQIPSQVQMKSELYYSPNKVYYLICSFTKGTPDNRYVITLLSQFASEWFIGREPLLVVKEHTRPIVKARALQKLAALEQPEVKSAKKSENKQ